MATQKQMFPITYKPGILRDGSPFQGSYSTSGQWVRFFRGQPQNIGGMRNYVLYLQTIPELLPPSSTPTAVLIYYDTDGNKHILVGVSLVTQQHKYSVIDATYNNIGSQTLTYFKKFTNPTNTLTQFVVVISIINTIPTQMILCLGMKNYTDINSSEAISTILAKETTDGFFQVNFPDFVLQEATGGMLYVGSRLFYYGNNGLVRWSSIAAEKSGDQTDLQKPFLFFKDKYSINISTDKVIYGAEWRGGANSPTIIFWTLGSVVLITNTTGSNNQVIDDPDDLSFSKKVLSRDSSILSSNSVVEYDGIFYWPGTQRFFVFNGVVLPLENNLNRQTFFDSLDMTKRQRVFGVKNVSRDEIWWFYPEKGKDANVGCTRAVIYNVVDNTWYDTGIERAAGYFDNTGGNMYTVGKNLSPYEGDNNSYVWQHEVGNDQVNLYKEVDQQVKSIPSFFTTPIISYATFNPQKQVAGIDYNIAIERIEPNIVGTKKIKMTVSINTYEYPASTPVTATYNLTEDGELENIIRPAINERKQGRNINFTFKSEGIGSGYQMGTTFVLAEIDDGRP
ncbi:MAG: hypothetical protein H6910_05070 [Rickettsiaceae bacterium]|nr:hypothetical protein [Rickettsiaceae bacterium]MCP5378472.1 hypothetical protein [Rickettsiaceae bacterium]